MSENNKQSDYNPPTLEDVVQAAYRIRKYINETPLLQSTSLNKMVDPETKFYFKCEMFQKCGVYKFRGVSNSLLKLIEEHPEVDTVITASSGNHGQALAYGCREFGLKAHIVMPTTSPEIKRKAVSDFGAKITISGPSTDERKVELDKLQKKTNGFIVHPYDSFNTIAGQGTMVLEILREVPDIDAIVAPVGGGGMLGGIAIAAKGINPNIKVFGAEPIEVDDASQSKQNNCFTKNTKQPKTIADGLMTDLGQLNWPIVRDYVDEIITVEEKDIAKAMFNIMERLKVVVEPSGATSYAAVNTEKFKQKKLKKVALVLSGGNIEFNNMPNFLSLYKE